MLRTAEELIKDIDSALLFSDVKTLMIQYAKQAIEEAAENATVESVEFWQGGYPMVDKSSILSLIDELK